MRDGQINISLTLDDLSHLIASAWKMERYWAFAAKQPECDASDQKRFTGYAEIFSELATRIADQMKVAVLDLETPKPTIYLITKISHGSYGNRPRIILATTDKAEAFNRFDQLRREILMEGEEGPIDECEWNQHCNWADQPPYLEAIEYGAGNDH